MGNTYTIEPAWSFEGDPDGFDVYEHGVYEESSVLHGQQRRTFMDSFQTLNEAKEAYPQAELLKHSTKPNPLLDRVASLGPCPESWFDPSAAGERWDDDY